MVAYHWGSKLVLEYYAICAFRVLCSVANIEKLSLFYFSVARHNETDAEDVTSDESFHGSDLRNHLFKKCSLMLF